MLRDKFINLKPLTKILILTIPIILFFIIGLLFYFSTRTANTDIHIKNFSEVSSSIPKHKIQAIENQIASIISASTDIEISNLSSDLYIRPNSYTETISGNITTAEFLVDTDKYQQTFKIIVSWINDGSKDYLDDIIVNCPSITETKYPNSRCVGMDGSSNNITINLPHTDTLSTGEKYTVSMNYDDPENPYIEVFLEDACYNDDLIKRAELETKKWIKDTLKLNPEDYTYYTPDHFCRARGVIRKQ